MVLATLEFNDCLTDSPWFRENIHQHEKELEKTSKAIKSLIAHGKDLLSAAKSLSVAQIKFAQNLIDFKFECIGTQQTEDEQIIAESLKRLGQIIVQIEDERDRMLERAVGQFVQPLENFRKEHLGGAKEERRKFDKVTKSFCQSVEKNLNMKTSKVAEASLKEADVALEMEKKHFHQASMQYVLCLQEVQERKKFEFVETVLGFMYGWLTFYHQGHEICEDYKPHMTDLQYRIQKTRDNFDVTREESEQLMNKMLEVRGGMKPQESPGKKQMREGYLYLMEKKALGTTWIKYYCTYKKESKEFSMVPFNQTSAVKVPPRDVMILISCIRRASDSIERRFCFDITVQERPGTTMTLQAVSEDDRKLWLDAMDGKEPIYHETTPQTSDREYTGLLDDIGFNFVRRCTAAIEKRGITDQGIYRVVGVSSKVNKLVTYGLDKRKAEKLDLEKDGEWEVKTITSALKTYFRSLPQPLMTFKFHEQFIEAAKLHDKDSRIQAIHSLVYQLPDLNKQMLEELIAHLRRVADRSKENLMTVANIGVCFGPTLLRPEEETIAAIMDIKFCNIIVEILIENYIKIFKSQPDVNANSKVIVPSTFVSDLKDTLPPGIPDDDDSSTPTHASSAASTPSLNSVNNAPASPRQTYAEARAKLRPSTIYNPSSGSGTGYSPRYSYTGEGFSNSNSSSSESLNSRSSAGLHTLTGYSAQSSPNLDDVTRRSPRISNVANRVTAYTNQVASEIKRSSETSPSCNIQRQTDGNIYQNTGPALLLTSTQNNTQDCGLNMCGHQALATKISPREVSCPQRSPKCVKKAINNNTGKPKAPPKPQTTAKMGGGPLQALRKRISNESMKTISSSTTPGNSQGPRRKVRTLYACDAGNDSELSFEPNEIISNVRKSREPGWLEGTLRGRNGLVPENYVEFID